MVKYLQSRNITLRELIDECKLELVEDDQFFYEWQESSLEITSSEKELLDKIKAGFFNLITYPPLLEKPIRETIVTPLLFLADFYLPPFQVRAEESIEISVGGADDEIILRGSLDILVLKDRFWLLVVEAKRAGVSIEEGLAQLLSYLFANPDRNRSSFGLITNGASFLFVKLSLSSPPRYATSDQFDMRRRGNDLYDVLRILKQVAQLSI